MIAGTAVICDGHVCASHRLRTGLPVGNLTRHSLLDASKLVVEVAAEQEPLPKGVPFSLVIAQGLSSPEQGLSPAAGITISSDAKEGAVASVAIEHVPTVKGCKYTADVHGGMIQLVRIPINDIHVCMQCMHACIFCMMKGMYARMHAFMSC